MRSFWERGSWLTFDVAIVGGGIIGISTAIECATRHPEWRVLLLERNLLPTGASTRNAGFACVGSLSEIASDIDLMGRDTALDLVRRRLQGLQLLHERCDENDIGYSEDGASEIFITDHSALARIDEVNAILKPLFGRDVFAERRDLITEYGVSDSVHTMIHTPFEGTLHSGKLLSVLWSMAARLGVHIRTGATVVSTDELNGGVELIVRTSHEDVTVIARQVVIATNAMIPSLANSAKLPEIVPGRGQVLITKPLTNLALKGSFHADEGFYYFRPIEDRVLIGGGRNLDFNGEQTASLDTTERIQSSLEHMLRTVVLPHHSEVEIDLRWAGTMAFTTTKQPYVDFVTPSTIVAFGCNGMGVALSSEVARECAGLLDR
ncbi:MAG: FAD-dependent oxidoreductase [Candidatus Kapabacteria bacterium]|nr:FAD-dependent oxidoreductase [Candidatus Kapabacteria bacterium]